MSLKQLLIGLLIVSFVGIPPMNHTRGTPAPVATSLSRAPFEEKETLSVDLQLTESLVQLNHPTMLMVLVMPSFTKHHPNPQSLKHPRRSQAVDK